MPYPRPFLLIDFTVALSLEGRTLLAPDLSIVLREREHIIGERMIEGVPDIVVEILSSDRNRDLVRKRQLYAAAGIPRILDFRLSQRQRHAAGTARREVRGAGRAGAVRHADHAVAPRAGDTIGRHIPQPPPPAALGGVGGMTGLGRP